MKPPNKLERTDPKHAFLYAKRHNKICPELERTISGHPIYAMLYAVEILNARWLIAEPVIVANSFSSFAYASSFGFRWEVAEKMMLEQKMHHSYSFTYPQWGCLYARNVIKGRWEQAEPIIATDPYWAYSYALNVLKGRFEFGEPIIAKNRTCALQYVRHVLKAKTMAIDFYKQCFENNTLHIHDLSKTMQKNEELQIFYFAKKLLK
jgi:hypothetical protein